MSYEETSTLIVVAVLMALVVLCSVMLFVTVLGHRDDSQVGTAKVAKVVTVLSFWLAFCITLFLPFDVTNSKINGGANTEFIWASSYMIVAFFLFFLIPFAMFYYESDPGQHNDPDTNCCQTQLGYASRFAVVTLLLMVCVTVIIYMYAGIAEVPLVRIAQSREWVKENDFNSADELPNILPCLDGTCNYTLTESCPNPIDGSPNLCVFSIQHWEVPMTYPVFVMAFLSFVGWFLLAVYGGVGLFSLPFQWINEVRTKTSAMPKRTYLNQKAEIGSRVKDLITVAEDMLTTMDTPGMSAKQKKKQKAAVAKLEKFAYLIKKDISILDTVRDLKKVNLCVIFGKALLGALTLAISVAWVAHIGVFMLGLADSQFLNYYLEVIEVSGDIGEMLAVVLYTLFSYYLMWCVVQGCYKVGINIGFAKVYPMEVNNTTMNSFLANSWFILLTSAPVTHFCVDAFPLYSKLTQINMIFATQVEYIKGLSYFYQQNVFPIAMCVFALVTLLWQVLHPDDRSLVVETEIKRLKEERKALADEEANSKKNWRLSS